MGFIQNWIDRKRRRELERINREIEELKRRGPDFTRREAVVMKKESIKGTGGGMFTAKAWSIILLLALIGVAAFYQWKMGDLKEAKDATMQQVTHLQSQLSQALAELNKTEEELEEKEMTKASLSTQYAGLQQEVVDLKELVKELNMTLATTEDEVSDLTQELLEKDLYLEALEACIENNTIDDKEDCL